MTSARVEFDTTELSVCVVCLHLLANGEYNDGEDSAEKAWEGQQKIWGDDMRHLIAGSDCDDNCTRHDDPDECKSLDQGFSWSTCDGCGSDFGGDRFLAYAMIPQD